MRYIDDSKKAKNRRREAVVENNSKEPDYLQSAVWLTDLDRNNSVDRNQLLDVYTDGEWVWTSDFIIRVGKNKKVIPKRFSDRMEGRDYLPPTKDELGEELLEELRQFIHQRGIKGFQKRSIIELETKV